MGLIVDENCADSRVCLFAARMKALICLVMSSIFKLIRKYLFYISFFSFIRHGGRTTFSTSCYATRYVIKFYTYYLMFVHILFFYLFFYEKKTFNCLNFADIYFKTFSNLISCHFQVIHALNK